MSGRGGKGQGGWRVGAVLVMGALALAACQAGYDGPTRSTFQDPANNRELEPPNSLPPGFTTNHPLAPATGVIGTFGLGR